MDSTGEKLDTRDTPALHEVVRDAIAQAFNATTAAIVESGRVIVDLVNDSNEYSGSIAFYEYDNASVYTETPRHVAGGQSLLLIQAYPSKNLDWADIGEINMRPGGRDLIVAGSLHATDNLGQAVVDRICRIPEIAAAVLGLQAIGDVRVAPRLASSDQRLQVSRMSIERELQHAATLPSGWRLTTDQTGENRMSQPPLVSLIKDIADERHHLSACVDDPSTIDIGSTAEAIAIRARLIDPFRPRVWNPLELRHLHHRLLGSTNRSEITLNTWSPREVFAFTRQSFANGTRAGALALLAQQLAPNAGNISGGISTEILERVGDAELADLGLERTDLALLQHRAVLVRALERTPRERFSSLGALALTCAHETGHELVIRLEDKLEARGRDKEELWTRLGEVVAEAVGDQQATDPAFAMLQHVTNRINLVGIYGAQNRGEFVAEAMSTEPTRRALFRKVRVLVRNT